MYKITKDFTFSAAHKLHGLPDGHPCAREHGHNYTVRVCLQAGDVDSVGFVVDYNELDELKHWLDQTFDHRNLNDVLPFNPTAENIARYIFDWCRDRWPEVVSVSVSETAKTWATYSPFGTE